MFYVPSKGRAATVATNLPSWLATGLPVFLVVYDDEVEAYERAVHGSGAGVVPVCGVPEEERGVGFNRQACLEHADAAGHPWHIQCDDDFRAPPNTSDLLVALRDHPQAGFVSAWKRYYDFGLMIYRDDPRIVVQNRRCMVCSGFWAIRHHPFRELGGFDTSLRLAEDTEAVLRIGQATGALPLMHKGVVGMEVGKRHAPGGCASTGSYLDQAMHATAVLNARYGPGTARVTLRPTKNGSKVQFTIWAGRFWKRMEKELI